MKKLLLSLFIVSVFLVGCATTKSPKMIAERNSANLLKLKIGMTPGAVKRTMGGPDFQESYPTAGGEPTVVWFYYTDPYAADDVFTKDECTRILFENDTLAWIGK
jgi:hypothetical protein